jgi:hypothetical protein
MDRNFRHQQRFDHLIVILAATLVCLVLLFLVVLIGGAVGSRVELADAGINLRENVEDLQEITVDLGNTLDQLSSSLPESEGDARQLEALDSALGDVNQQLQVLEAELHENIDETVLTEDIPVIDSLPITDVEQRDIDRMFTIVVWGIALLSIISAIALLVTFNTRLFAAHRKPVMPIDMKRLNS